MTDVITPELFAYLVELAALELAPAEAEYLRGQLNLQLKAVAELERIALPDDVPPAAHGVSFTALGRPALRADEPRPDPDTAAKILAQAPETDEGYFVVPEIPHTEL
jgi:aspartyl/glutamyl-tRNA(Asn/Gln) amidotransferase C subunit